MTTSKKQVKANKKNAKKGGVKTSEGKEIVKYNALKHGLLAKEAVITVGDAAESQEEFSTLLEDLKNELNPVGVLKEMLVEKIAVAYWRLRRAYRYEVGLIRKELDNATDDFYRDKDWEGKKYNKTDEEIEQQINEEREGIEYWKKDKKDLAKMHKNGKSLEVIYDWEDNWDWLYDKVSDLLEDCEEGLEPKEIREQLNEADWSDDRIWETLIEICDERIQCHEESTMTLEKDKQRNKLRLQVIKKLGSIPSRLELDRLLRYEGAIERQLYKALNQLERIQRLRAGDNVLPPVEVDVNVNTGQPA